MDDFESPEVQKDFPGLYTPGPSKSKKEEAEFAPDKDKKDKKKDKKDKDKGYAALACNESSPDEDDTTKSPSKSKRIKAFKFPLKKEKREKSRDKDQVPSCSAKKEKKERKLKSSAGPEVPQELGDAQPIFGVPLAVAVERGRCHDMENLPLVVRDCIDFLQEHGNDGIYKSTDTAKETKVQNLKKLYNNRESNGLHDLDTATAAALLKLYLRELPEPIFTTELLSQFEEVSANSDVKEQEKLLRELVGQLPTPNQTLLKWVALHLDSVSEHEGTNASSLSMLLSPVLQTSQRLFVTILCHCRSLFILPSAETTALPRYIPPLSGPNPVLPETRDGILQELSKQESLLSQIHSEMNSGFVTKRREEQLWEVQRIITQLKRKLRQVDKVDTQKSIEDTVDSQVRPNDPVEVVNQSNSDGVATITATTSPTETDQATTFTITETGLLKLPTDHPEADNFIQLQLENYELHRWRDKLQAAINQEKAEILALQKQMKDQQPNLSPEKPERTSDDNTTEIQQLLAQNAFLESTRKLLCDEIMSEHKWILDLRVQLASATVAI